nr:histidine phosphotransferase family protein [Shimia biformata]
MISPVGAIGNGLELLEMTGLVDGPEMALIADSVANAAARIRLFRIAFGLAGEGQQVAGREAAEILAALAGDGRTHVTWAATGDMARVEAKALFLALMCLQKALPYGDPVTISGGAGGWVLTADAPRHRADDAFVAKLTAPGDDLPPGEVEFALLPFALADCGLVHRIEVQPGRVVLRLSSA